MTANRNILSINNASVGFRKKNNKIVLLEHLNLNVKQGELVGLIGRNGAGKSTLLHSLVRLHYFLEGEILLKNKNILSYLPTTFAQSVAFVSSGISYPETMTVREMVSLGRFPYTNWIGKLTVEDIDIIEDALRNVGITSLSERPLSEISDGERQKAMIARTLAQDTEIIILDEPTAFLDLPSKFDIIGLFHDLRSKGKTIIFSTHDLNIALRLSDKIWLIDKKTVHAGAPEDLILDKTIAGIFDSDKIHLNQNTGDFELRRNGTKKLCMKCHTDNVSLWTLQALQRSGYDVVAFDENLPLIISGEKNNKIFWEIKRFKESFNFDNIYDLLESLGSV